MAEATLYQQPGQNMDWVATGNVAAGAVVPLTYSCGIAADAITSGATGVLYTTGYWTVPTVTNAAFAYGDALYWDDSANVATKVAAGNTPLGTCRLTKGSSGATTVVDIATPQPAIKAANVAALTGSSTVGHVETGVNAILTALKAANLMASS